MDRRKFVAWLLNGGSLIALGILAVPALITALSPATRRRPAQLWQPVGPLDAFAIDGVGKAVVEVPREDWAATLRERGVYVWRRSEQEVVVFARNCTDLSCPVTWDPGSQWFFCPCHGGIFSKDGERMAGPPKRPLYRYTNRIRDGVVEIDLRSLPPIT
jgi:menaquinol-cytochrome c reductase iron-sulfur subunit